jgi:hypothetical protein
MIEAPDIPGAVDVAAWFGYWPSFHDAEVLSITLDRLNASRVVIHTFEMTREVDARGYYVLDKNAIVTFFLEGFLRDQYGIANTRLEFFNHQNVLSRAIVNKTAGGYELVLEGCYGVDGVISAEHIRVEIAPAMPAGGVYQPLAGN